MLRAIEFLLLLWTSAARRASWLIAAVFIAATGAAAFYAVQNLKVNTDTSAMLDPQLPFQQRAAALRHAFPQIKEDLLVVVRAPTLDEADAFADALAGRLKAREALFSGVFSPATEPFFLENGLLYLETQELSARLSQMTSAAELIETLIVSPTAETLFTKLAENDALAAQADLGQDTLLAIYAELAAVVNASLNERPQPFSWMGAFDTDQSADKQQPQTNLRLVYATPVLDYTRLQPAKTAITALNDEIALLTVDFNGRVEAFVTGDPALRADELASVREGIGLSLLLSLVLVAALLLFAFRSFYMATLTLIALLISLTLTTAFAAYAIGELNLVSVAFTVLLIGLGLDFAIHLLLHVQERRAAGQNLTRALRGAVHEVGPAMALAAPTTALAFLSFVPTRFDGIAQLGVIAGAGVMIAFFVSVTFLPAALSILPKPRIKPAKGGVRRGFKVIENISTPITLLTIALGGAALFILPQARFDADPMGLRDPNSPSVRGFQLLFEDENATPYRLNRLVESAQEAQAMSERLGQIEAVRSVRSLPDFVPKDQDTKLDLIDFAASAFIFALDAQPDEPLQSDIKAGARALRDQLNTTYQEGPGAILAAALSEALARDDAEALARIEQNIFAFWPQLVERLRAQFNAGPVTLEDLPQSLADRYRSPDGQWRVDVLPREDVRERRALTSFVYSVETIYPDITGGALQTMKAGNIISEAMLQATLIALSIISVFLFWLVRRVSMVFFMLAPLALAAVLTAAAGVIFNIPFNYANVIVLPLLIGIGVDSGIHLVMRQQQVQAGEGLYGTSTPRAILFSALTTVASFGSLMLSPHRGTASMGELLSIAIAFTLICTLVVLPAAFRYGERNKQAPSPKALS